MTALPVDFRSCRGGRCGNGPDSGAVWASDTGEPAAAFVHVVDCRDDQARPRPPRAATTARASAPATSTSSTGSTTRTRRASATCPAGVGSHEDDWEGYQVRIGPGGTEARATSHHGYNYDGGAGSWLSDAGLVHRSAWGPSTGRLYVSGGSHAGHVHEDGQPSSGEPVDARPIASRWSRSRPSTAAARRTRFAVTRRGASPSTAIPRTRAPDRVGR